MKVLVTGSNGLLGKSLQKVVKKYNDSDSNDSDSNDSDSDHDIPFTYIFLTRKDGDLTNSSHVNDIFERHSPDIVVHLASCVGGVYDNMAKNYDFLVNNLHININIVDACKKYQVKKLINILSTCIFPDLSVTYPLTSDQLHNGLPHNSNIGYAYSKRILHVASELLSQHGTQVVNLIPTNLYGENDNYNLISSHVLPALIHKTYLAKYNNQPLNVNGSGSALRQFLYIDDLSSVIQYFVVNNHDEKSISCVVSPPEDQEISIRNAVSIIKEHLDFQGSIVYDISYSDGQLKKTATDIELKKYIPDFKFTPIQDGLKNTIEYFVTNYNNIRK